jgi:hypothetical protein
MIAAQRRHCVPDEGRSLVADTFHRADPHQKVREPNEPSADLQDQSHKRTRYDQFSKYNSNESKDSEENGFFREMYKA